MPPKTSPTPAPPSVIPDAVWKKKLAATMAGVIDEILPRERVSRAASPLVEELSVFLARPGKRVRPLLLLHSYRTFAGREPGEPVFGLAAALELLHAFILAHDDVIDRSDERSGLPTLHRAVESRLGVHHDRERVARSLAIVLGDMLFSGAQEVVLRSGFEPETCLRLARSLNEYMTQTGIGELEDVVFGAGDIGRISRTDVERMYWLKTTRYSIECPLVLGAIAAGVGRGVLDGIAAMSRPLGLAFQLRNDLNAFRQFEVSDAAVPDDFLEGKKTLLMAIAYEKLGETDRRLLQICLSQRPAGEATLSILKELVTKSGAVNEAEAVLRAALREGDERLEKLPVSEDHRARLCSALRFLGMVVSCSTAAASGPPSNHPTHTSRAS